MYSKILIATDGSDLASKAVDHGLRLAESVGAAVVIVTVTEAWSPLEMADDIQAGVLDATKVYEDAVARSAKAIIEDAMDRAVSASVVFETRHVKDCRPADGIMNTAELEACDLIVMASHGRRGLQRMLLGSQAAEVITLSKRPVLVIR
jgi:nucleotide-binding universal stress UspA family protein